MIEILRFLTLSSVNELIQRLREYLSFVPLMSSSKRKAFCSARWEVDYLPED